MNKYTTNNSFILKKGILFRTKDDRILLFQVEHNPLKTDIIRYYLNGYH